MKNESKVTGPILTEMALIRQWIEDNSTAPLNVLEEEIRRLNILSVRLYIMTHQW